MSGDCSIWGFPLFLNLNHVAFQTILPFGRTFGLLHPARLVFDVRGIAVFRLLPA